MDAAVALGLLRGGGEGQLTDEFLGAVVAAVRPVRQSGHGLAPAQQERGSASILAGGVVPFVAGRLSLTDGAGAAVIRLNQIVEFVERWRDRTHDPLPEPAVGSSLAEDDRVTDPLQLSHAAGQVLEQQAASYRREPTTIAAG